VQSAQHAHLVSIRSPLPELLYWLSPTTLCARSDYSTSLKQPETRLEAHTLPGMYPVETVAGPRHTAPGQKQVVHYSCAWPTYRRNLTPAEGEVGVSTRLNFLSRRYPTCGTCRDQRSSPRRAILVRGRCAEDSELVRDTPVGRRVRPESKTLLRQAQVPARTPRPAFCRLPPTCAARLQHCRQRGWPVRPSRWAWCSSVLGPDA
jgi:hypothetical protein